MLAETPEQPPNITLDWLHQLYGTIETGWLTLFSIDRTSGDQHVDWAPIDRPDQLAAAAHRRATTCCVWHGVATRTNRLNSGRGGAADCELVPGLWLDVDIAGPGHKSNHPYPPDETAALELIADFPIPPTAIIRSGGGLQPWWLFDEPRPAEDLVDVLAAWGATWNRHAAARGWYIDNVYDLARIMRLPGTWNRKTEPAPVTILGADFTNRYGIDDLDQFLDTPPEPPTPQAVDRLPYIGPERPGDAFNATHTGGEVLTSLGYTLGRRNRNGDEQWVRPGKPAKDGNSATVYADGHTTIWSETTKASHPHLELRRPYDPFGLAVATLYRGDWAEATRDLRSKGYGTPAQSNLTFTPSSVEVIAQELAATRTLPDTPAPLARNTSHGPPFPLHALPPWIAHQCAAVAESFQVPVDLPAMLALGALSTVTAGHIKVRLTGTAWTEHTNLYLVVALPPGTGKSPVFKVMTRPVVDLEKDLIRQRKKDVAEHEAKRDILERQLKGAREIAVKGGAASVMDAVRIAGELDDLEQPPTGQMIGEDITPEALVETLATNNGRLALLSSEGGIFDMMAGQYAEKGRTANLAVYLQGWSADSIRRKRVKSEAQVIPEAVLTICVTTQPGVVSSLAANPELVTRGLPVRFMFSLPPSNIGGRNRYRVLDDLDQAIRSVYDDTLSRIGRHWAHMLNPTTLEFTHLARDIYLDWDQQTEQRLAPGGDLAGMAEWHSKLRSSILRLAGILHAANEPATAEPIDEHTLADAIEIGTYWLEHARLVHDMWRTEPATINAHTVAAWAVAAGCHEFTLRDVYAANRRAFPTVEDVIPAVTRLIDDGWITPHQDLPVRALGPGKPGQRFTLRSDAAKHLAAPAPSAPLETSQDCGEPARMRGCAIGGNSIPPTYPQLPQNPSEIPEPSPARSAQPATEPAPTADHATSTTRKWQPILEPLRDTPDQWACIYHGPTNTARNVASHLQTGNAGIDPDEYEISYRTLDNGTGAVFTRYYPTWDTAPDTSTDDETSDDTPTQGYSPYPNRSTP